MVVWHVNKHLVTCIICNDENPHAIDLLRPVVPHFLVLSSLLPILSLLVLS